MIKKLSDWTDGLSAIGVRIDEHAQVHDGCGLPVLWKFRHVFRWFYGSMLALCLAMAVWSVLLSTASYLRLPLWEAVVSNAISITLVAFMLLAVEAFYRAHLALRIQVHENPRYQEASEWLKLLRDAPDTFRTHSVAHGCRLSSAWGLMRYSYPVIAGLFMATLVFSQRFPDPGRYGWNPILLEVEAGLSFVVTWFFAFMLTEGIRRAEMLNTVRAHESPSPDQAQNCLLPSEDA